DHTPDLSGDPESPDAIRQRAERAEARRREVVRQQEESRAAENRRRRWISLSAALTTAAGWEAPLVDEHGRRYEPPRRPACGHALSGRPKPRLSYAPADDPRWLEWGRELVWAVGQVEGALFSELVEKLRTWVPMNADPNYLQWHKDVSAEAACLLRLAWRAAAGTADIGDVAARLAYLADNWFLDRFPSEP